MLFGVLVRRLTAVCFLKLAQPYKLLSSRHVAAGRNIPSAFYSLGVSWREQTEWALASNPLRRVLWKVHYPQAHLFQSQRREKKTPLERKQMSAHLWGTNSWFFFVGGSRERRCRASHAEPHDEPPNQLRFSLTEVFLLCSPSCWPDNF